MMDDDRLYAVISGDIVESRRFMEKGPALRDAIKGAGANCAEAFEGAVCGTPPIVVFAGDSWQMLINSPAPALRVALCMRTLIKSSERLAKADTRLAIGIGTVEFIDRDNLAESQGEAFTLSGEALDLLRNDGLRIAVRLPQAGDDGPFDAQDTLDAMMTLLDAVCGEWTSRQSAIVAGALMGLDQMRIGDRLSITQPAVSQALRSAGWPSVEQTVRWWEHCRWERL